MQSHSLAGGDARWLADALLSSSAVTGHPTRARVQALWLRSPARSRVTRGAARTIHQPQRGSMALVSTACCDTQKPSRISRIPTTRPRSRSDRIHVTRDRGRHDVGLTKHQAATTTAPNREVCHPPVEALLGDQDLLNPDKRLPSLPSRPGVARSSEPAGQPRQARVSQQHDGAHGTGRSVLRHDRSAPVSVAGGGQSSSA